MKKLAILFLILVFSFLLMACNEKTATDEVIPTKTDETDYGLIWDEEYQDSDASFNDDTLKTAKLFYEGKYVSLDTNISKRKDSKKEFYTEDSLRFVNTPDKYAITLPKDTKVDYSIAKYRMQFSFNDSVLTVTHEKSNPYGSNASGWQTYLTEWVNRYIDNPKYLKDNDLSYTEKTSISTDLLDGYEVITYSIRINDADGIDKPYYNISIVREEKEYVEFYLLVMKSKNNETSLHNKIVKSFKQVKEYGYPKNYAGQYELKMNPNWNEETVNYFNKINNPETFEFGFFSYSLVDDEDITNRELVRSRYLAEHKRLFELNDYVQEICPTYSHVAWGNEPMHFPLGLATDLASGNGFNDKPVLQFTLQYTNNNNNVNIYNKDANYTPMFDILRGKYDAYFNRLAMDIKEYGKPVLFRLNNEMNTDWTSYCGMMTLLDPDIFNLTWQHLYDIFEYYKVDNCIWIFNPIAVSCPYSSWGEDLCYMPGVDYVQALGITRYEMLNDVESHKSFKDGYTILYEKNKDYWMNYPWVVSEFGCAAGGAITEYGEYTELYRNKELQAKWVKEMFDCLANKEENEFCKKISVMVWFNCDDIKDGVIMNSLHLDSSLTATHEALKEGLAKVNEKK